MTYEFVEVSEFQAFFKQHKKAMYQDDFAFSLEGVLSPEEKQKQSVNTAKLAGLDSYYLLAKQGDKIVGWSYGIQKGADEFFMKNSAVFPAYRRSGVYTGMLEKAVGFLSDKGFQRIYSLHKMTNNPILIAKLRFGFVLTGFRVTDRNGCMAELTYFTNEKRKSLLEIRVGARKLDAEMMQHIV